METPAGGSTGLFEQCINSCRQWVLIHVLTPYPNTVHTKTTVLTPQLPVLTLATNPKKCFNVECLNRGPWPLYHRAGAGTAAAIIIGERRPAAHTDAIHGGLGVP